MTPPRRSGQHARRGPRCMPRSTCRPVAARVLDLPVSRRVTASVGRHCIASTKKTSAAATWRGVKSGLPSSRVMPRMRATTPSSTSRILRAAVEHRHRRDEHFAREEARDDTDRQLPVEAERREHRLNDAAEAAGEAAGLLRLAARVGPGERVCALPVGRALRPARAASAPPAGVGDASDTRSATT